MIPLPQRIIAITLSLLLLVITLQLIRTRRLREQHAFLWLLASGSIFFLSLFGGIVPALAQRVNVSYSPTLVLVGGLLFALALLLAQTVTISAQADQICELAQTVAILDFRLHQLEEQPVADQLEQAVSR